MRSIRIDMFDAPLGFDEEDSEKEEHSERGSGEGVGMGIVAGDVVDGEVGIGEGESNPPVIGG